MSKKNISNKRCYLCKKQTIQSGYLMSCSDGSCGCVFWDDLVKTEIKLLRKNYSYDKNVLITLKDAGVNPYYLDNPTEEDSLIDDDIPF